MSSNLRRLQEFLAAVFTAQLETFSGEPWHFRSLPYQFQAGLELLMSQLMLFELLGVLTDFTTSFALKRIVFRISSSNIVGGGQYREEVLTVLSRAGAGGGGGLGATI